jgi:hypothetical protein
MDAPLMVVRPDVGGGRAYLQDDAKPCVSGARCTFVRKAYLVPGDQVLVSAPYNGFRCAYFGAHGRLSVGFVPEAALEVVAHEDLAATPSFLQGRWRDSDDALVFAVTGSKVSVAGEAYWPGKSPAYRPDGSIISVHEGDVEGEVQLRGAQFDVSGQSEDDCHVWGRRRGPYLIVEDNFHCGGANVRFEGLYVKVGP